MAVTVSELFREYESDLERLLQEIGDRLDAAEAGKGDVQQSLSEAERRATEAEQSLRQMDMEARSMPTDQRSSLEPALGRYRADLRERRRALEAAKQAHARSALLGADAADGATVIGKSAQDRQRMLGVSEQLQGTSSRLEEARRQALEAEQIGIDVMSDLRQQRDTISRTRANVGEIGANTGVAKQLLESIARRAKANRLITYAVVVFLALAVAVAGYLMMHGGSGGGG